MHQELDHEAPSWCIIQCFERQATATPKNLALILEDGSALTYEELDRRAEVLAASIRENVRVTTQEQDEETPRVSIMSNRGVGLVTAVLAVLKCGAAYVPIDPSFPPDRQAHIANHSVSCALIIDKSLRNEAEGLGQALPPLLLIDNSTGYLVDEEKEVLVNTTSRECDWIHQPQADGLAYVLYTSGSTGKPKGVMVYNKSVVNIVQWFADDMALAANDKVLGLTTFCFDISVLEMFLPLIRGAALVLTSSRTQKDPHRICNVLKDQNVTVMQATPTTYEMMLTSGWPGDKTINFLVGGEAFRPLLLPLITNSKSLRNVYGPTETTIWSSSYTFGKESSSTSTPIGTPISETQFYVVDDQLRCVPDGEEGELIIAGLGVAKGYLHAPELTAQRFIDNPFGDGKAYRTGDIVFKQTDGNYVFGRRADDQVKIHGYRIELGEVEAAVSAHPSVAQAIVVVRQNALVAYVKLKASNVSAENLVEFAGRAVPRYMLPRLVVFVDSFPQTANGKLDRKALPDPWNVDITDAHDQLSNASSSITMADHIASIVFQVNGRKPYPDETMFSLGIDSLASVLFQNLLSRSLRGISLSPAQLYESDATIAVVARQLYNRVKDKNPKLLDELHIIGAAPGLVNESSDPTYANCDLEQGGRESLELRNVQSCAPVFEASLLANRKLFEGIRGILTGMVLFDHFHHRNWNVGTRWEVDVVLFVLMSGFTVSLQHIKTTRQSVTTEAPWSLRKFLFTRWVGLFPQQYLAMVLVIPRWYFTWRWYDSSTKQTVAELVLMASGCLTWTKFNSRQVGELYFTSLLWSVFLIYSVFKTLIQSQLNVAVKAVLFTVMVAILGVAFWLIFPFRNPSYFFVFFALGMFVARKYSHLYNQIHSSGSSSVLFDSLSPQARAVCSALWKYAPDALIGVIAFVLAFQRWDGYVYDAVMTYIGLPITASVALLLLVLQDPTKRSIFSWLLFENPISVLVGECSYAIYLVQVNIMNFWFRLLVEDIKYRVFPVPRNFNYSISWSKDQPTHIQVAGVVLTVVVAAFFQKVFQEMIVSSIVLRWYRPMQEDDKKQANVGNIISTDSFAIFRRWSSDHKGRGTA